MSDINPIRFKLIFLLKLLIYIFPILLIYTCGRCKEPNREDGEIFGEKLSNILEAGTYTDISVKLHGQRAIVVEL